MDTTGLGGSTVQNAYCHLTYFGGTAPLALAVFVVSECRVSDSVL